MLNSPNKQACVKLTTEQIEAIKQQTGLDQVPETACFSVDVFIEGKGLRCSLSDGPDTTLGLVHEINRT